MYQSLAESKGFPYYFDPNSQKNQEYAIINGRVELGV
tara:strand:- start:375 stop:485 length:111 start_codon:yes stop_codon:yes gene_type:complete